MLSGPRQRCWHFGMQNSYIRYPPRLTKGKRNVRHQTWHSWSAPLLLGVSFFSFKNIFVLRIRDRSQYFPIITISVDFCIISYHLKNQTFQGLAVSQYKDKLCLIAMSLDGHCPKPTERKSLAPVPIVTTYRAMLLSYLNTTQKIQLFQPRVMLDRWETGAEGQGQGEREGERGKERDTEGERGRERQNQWILMKHCQCHNDKRACKVNISCFFSVCLSYTVATEDTLKVHISSLYLQQLFGDVKWNM